MFFFQNKCARYWPEVGTAKDYGKVQVKHLMESVNAHYTLREFEVFSEGTCPDHKIYQYHFQVTSDLLLTFYYL